MKASKSEILKLAVTRLKDDRRKGVIDHDTELYCTWLLQEVLTAAEALAEAELCN